MPAATEPFEPQSYQRFSSNGAIRDLNPGPLGDRCAWPIVACPPIDLGEFKWLAAILGLGGEFGAHRQFVPAWKRHAALTPDTFYDGSEKSGVRHYLYVSPVGELYRLEKKLWWRELYARFQRKQVAVDLRPTEVRWRERGREFQR